MYTHLYREICPNYKGFNVFLSHIKCSVEVVRSSKTEVVRLNANVLLVFDSITHELIIITIFFFDRSSKSQTLQGLS